MICLIKKFKSGVEIAPLFLKNETKKFLPAGKKGFRGFRPKQQNGVKTPSWRILGIKKCSHYSEQNKFALKNIMLHFVSINFICEYVE